MISDLEPLQSAPVENSRITDSLTHSFPFCVPSRDEDVQQFARLSDAVRNDVDRTLILLRRIHHARSKSAEANFIANERQGLRGYSAKSLLRKYYAYVASGGDWRAVLDKAQAGPAFWQTDSLVGLPAGFIDFWKGLCERNQRKNAPARRELIKIWKTGRDTNGKAYKQIPGYPQWSPSFPSLPSVEIPAGWSEANLNRYSPSKAELAAARIGREALAQYTPKVFKTRAGIAVGQFYAFDDQEYDVKVNFPGSSTIQRPVGLNCLDIASAYCVAWGTKPVLIDDEGVKKKGLAQYMPLLVAHILCNVGFRNKVAPVRAAAGDSPGTTLILESGSATLSDDLIERIERVTGGAVTAHKGKTSNTPSFPGLFEGSSKGNPRFKAHLESFFNLVRNDMAMLPGQVGKDRDHCPVEMYGRERYAQKLLKAAERLSPERRNLIKLPVLNYHQFVLHAAEIYRDINNRTEHDLEGWEKCGHFAQEIIVSLGGQEARMTEADWLALPAEKQNALRAFATSQSRYLSPQEVWNRSASGLQKLDYACIPALLGPAHGIERTVGKRGYISFEERDLDSDPFLFYVGGNRVGEKFLTYQIPFAPDTLVLADAQGRYVGMLVRQAIPRLDDVEGIAASIKYQAKKEAELLAPAARRAIPLAIEKRDMHRHNAAVFEGQPITDADWEAANALKARVRKVTASDVADLVGCNDPLPPSAQDARAASALECGDSAPLSLSPDAPNHAHTEIAHTDGASGDQIDDDGIESLL